MKTEVAVLAASFRRDWRIARSYRLAFVLRVLGTVFQVVVFFYISQLVGIAGHPSLAAYGGNYFAYVLIGLAFQRFFNLSLAGYAASLTEAQQTGTLEAQAVLPVSLFWLAVGSNLWPYLYATAETLLYLLMGVVLGAPLAGANLWGAALITLLASLAISGPGLMGAAVILLYKRGNAVAWGVEAAAALLSGVFFPPELLPTPLARLSVLLPQTHALAGLRAALLEGAPTAALGPQMAILVGFSLVLVPLGVLALNLSYRRAQVKGSLAQY